MIIKEDKKFIINWFNTDTKKYEYCVYYGYSKEDCLKRAVENAKRYGKNNYSNLICYDPQDVNNEKILDLLKNNIKGLDAFDIINLLRNSNLFENGLVKEISWDVE